MEKTERACQLESKLLPTVVVDKKVCLVEFVRRRLLPSVRCPSEIVRTVLMIQAAYARAPDDRSEIYVMKAHAHRSEPC